VILLQFNNESDNTTRPLVYDYLFEVINQYVTSPQRDKWTRPLLFYLDEFYYMATIKALEYEAARAIKTWRNHRAGFRPIDQSAEAFYGVRGRAEEAGALIVGAVAHRFFYRLSGEAVDIVAQAHRGILSPQHLEQMKYLDTGQCVAMFDTSIHTLNVDLTPQERRYLVERQAPQEWRKAA
jgi:type IV secretory pathway VirB4 component